MARSGGGIHRQGEAARDPDQRDLLRQRRQRDTTLGRRLSRAPDARPVSQCRRHHRVAVRDIRRRLHRPRRRRLLLQRPTQAKLQLARAKMGHADKNIPTG